MSEREHWDAADYTWASSSFETEFETGPEGANQIQSINDGSLANFHPGLVNYRTGDAHFNPILDRRSDPGAGAFSDYTGFSFTSRYMKLGKEKKFTSHMGELVLVAFLPRHDSVVGKLQRSKPDCGIIGFRYKRRGYPR